MNETLRKAKVLERRRNAAVDEASQKPCKPGGLTMLAHDLRSGIASIFAYSEALPLLECEELEKMSEGLRLCSRRLVRMLGNLIALDELGAGGRRLRLENIDVIDTVVHVASEFALKAKGRDISFVMDVPVRVQRAALDREMFERALANLLDNGLRYTPDGKAVSLGVGKSRECDREYLVVSVSDEGPGILPQETEKVFDKFYRSNAGPRTKGTGLGLAIVKAVAEAHGGRVELKTGLGKGSRFAMILPYRQA